MTSLFRLNEVDAVLFIIDLHEAEVFVLLHSIQLFNTRDSLFVAFLYLLIHIRCQLAQVLNYVYLFVKEPVPEFGVKFFNEFNLPFIDFGILLQIGFHTYISHPV